MNAQRFLETSSLSSESLSQPPFPLSKGGVILTTISGILSTICSFVILNIIRTSPEKLSTTYHRMMTFMSVFDIMASICFALTTLPMPTGDVMRFAGPMLGNETTCQIQGFILILGLIGGGSLYMCLSWYFVCKLSFRVDSYTIKKWIEPTFYLCSLVLTLFAACYSLHKDMIHTGPRNSVCLIAPDHSYCKYSNIEGFFDCDQDMFPRETEGFSLFRVFAIGLIASMIALAMVIIIFTIFKKSRRLKQSIENRRSDELINALAEEDDEVSELRYSRVLVIQALMYIFAYTITWVFLLIVTNFNFDRQTSDRIQVFKSIFLPLQGFWNLMIFVYDKAYLVKRNDENRGYCHAVMMILLYPIDAPSRIILNPSLTSVMNDCEANTNGIQNLMKEKPLRTHSAVLRSAPDENYLSNSNTQPMSPPYSAGVDSTLSDRSHTKSSLLKLIRSIDPEKAILLSEENDDDAPTSRQTPAVDDYRKFQNESEIHTDAKQHIAFTPDGKPRRPIYLDSQNSDECAQGRRGSTGSILLPGEETTHSAIHSMDSTMTPNARRGSTGSIYSIGWKST